MKPNFQPNLTAILNRFASVQLPIDVGFGIQSQAAISQLKGQADIVIIGTQAVKLYVEQGAAPLERFMRDLRNCVSNKVY